MHGATIKIIITTFFQTSILIASPLASMFSRAFLSLRFRF